LLLAGEHPNGPTRDKTKDRLKKLLAAGIECFVDLTKPTELLRYDTYLPFYVEYTRKSIKDHGVPGARAQMSEILDYIANSMRAGRPVYVHCRAGIGRTGTVVGCLLVERGLSGDSAIDELNRLWQQCRRSKSWPYIPETDAQAAYVREWQPTLESAGFELSSLATAVATVGPMTTAGSIRPSVLSVADVQARAANQATGAGQARAAVENLAAAKGRIGSNNSGAGHASGGGLSAAATHARAAVERGEISPSIRAEISDAIASRNPPVKAGSEAPTLVDGLPSIENGPLSISRDAPTSRADSGAAALRSGGEPSSRASTGNGRRSTGGAPESRGPQAGTSAAPESRGPQAGTGALAKTHDLDGSATLELPGPGTGAHRAVPSRAPRQTNQPETPDSVASLATRSPLVIRSPAEPAADFDPLLDPATLEVARNLRERFVGTLFGLAVGDAVAAATQFRRPGSFSPVGDMIGGGPFDLPRGAWSDDTAMALCLAESLLECDGFDARDQVRRYSRWQQEGYLTSTGQCVGITASTARSLALAKWRRVVFPGSHDPEQLDPEPLSRIAPIALFYFASPETTLVQAADASRTTCQAPAVLDACRRLGRALNAALSGQPKTKTLADVANITEIAAQTNNTAATALAAALWAFSSTDNFRDAVLRAANVGGNSDVVASVCGQLAGAHYGASAIPQSWRSGLIEKDLIEGYADRLLAHSLVSLSHS
jgi:ADP-ribosyl-[dinitrogen reductase] hydrolase